MKPSTRRSTCPISRMTAFILACCLGSGSLICHAVERKAVVFRDGKSAPVEFAAGKIREALQADGFSARLATSGALHPGDTLLRIVLATPADKTAARQLLRTVSGRIVELGPQAYQIVKTKAGGTTVWLFGGDSRGLMYAGLELAEQIRLEGADAISARRHRPFILRRGIKFNIPLDVRTPSYDDTGDAAARNYAPMWDFAFWEGFLDRMAEHRYNTLTLWNPHPFPSIVKLPDYPDVALDDVCVTTLKRTYKSGAWHDPMFVHAEVFDHLKVVRKMTIDQKIAFWRRVMRHAKDRGIDVYFITWNVLVNGTQGKYGITPEQDNPQTIAYLRQCVRETVLTYPDLAGIGVTAGENMRNRNDEFAKEKWLWQTYGLGVLDAKKEQPDRKIRFLHRVWQTGVDGVMTDFGEKYPDTFELGFKYARAHLYSATDPPFSDQLCEEMKPHGVKCWWNLRNDDLFHFRWGDPDYVRDFLRHLPPAELTAGYHMGSDGYVWGRESISLEPDRPRQLEIDKHWYRFMLWGRLGYDPTLDRAFFEKVLADRFPDVSGGDLYDAWATASKIVPQVTRLHWCNWDFMWAVEGCFDQRKGFHTVDDFIKTAPMERSGIVPIPDYVRAQLAGKPVAGTTPNDVAERLDAWAEHALKGVAGMRNATASMEREPRRTLADIEAMAHLGHYYSAKIRGAVELCAFRQSKDDRRRKNAVEALLKAQNHWQRYADVAAGLYRPQLLARTRVLDWHKLLDDVKRDVEIARGAAGE